MIARTGMYRCFQKRRHSKKERAGVGGPEAHRIGRKGRNASSKFEASARARIDDDLGEFSYFGNDGL
jgi:hypothetical protein